VASRCQPQRAPATTFEFASPLTGEDALAVAVRGLQPDHVPWLVGQLVQQAAAGQVTAVRLWPKALHRAAASIATGGSSSFRTAHAEDAPEDHAGRSSGG